MKIRAILLDDEQSALDNMNLLLSRYCQNIELIASFSSPKAALARISDLDFDLLFLDIEMPEMSGFDFLDKVEELDFQVIFITSYNQYALKAIRYSALDYILKPIDIDELIAAVKRVEDRYKDGMPIKPSSQVGKAELKCQKRSPLHPDGQNTSPYNSYYTISS